MAASRRSAEDGCAPCANERWERPESVEQALIQVSSETWEQIALRVFHCSPNLVDIETVIRNVKETNACLNLDPPVEVCIDPDGEFTIRVYDQR